MQGYTLTGRTVLFPSYESFLGIVHTMMLQYAKFVKIAREVSWRGGLPSINYIETSTWARQEHNGFSHQNPSFIGAVLNIKPEAARVRPAPLQSHVFAFFFLAAALICVSCIRADLPLGLPSPRRQLFPLHHRPLSPITQQD